MARRQPKHFDENSLAERWDVSTRTLQRWRQLGTGPDWLMIGGRVRYSWTAVVTYERRSLHQGDKA